MNKVQFVIVDGIKWFIQTRIPTPLCPQHHVRLWPKEDMHSRYFNFQTMSRTLKCEEGQNTFSLPRSLASERIYVIDRLDAVTFSGQRFINLDDVAIPIAKDKISTESAYFVKSVLTKSKVGLRLVIYAGKK